MGEGEGVTAVRGVPEVYRRRGDRPISLQIATVSVRTYEQSTAPQLSSNKESKDVTNRRVGRRRCEGRCGARGKPAVPANGGRRAALRRAAAGGRAGGAGGAGGRGAGLFSHGAS